MSAQQCLKFVAISSVDLVDQILHYQDSNNSVCVRVYVIEYEVRGSRTICVLLSVSQALVIGGFAYKLNDTPLLGSRCYVGLDVWIHSGY